MCRTILIVDDEDDARAIAMLGLNMRTDWTLLEANSGRQAIDIASEQQPDLILLDIVMPEMNGKITLQKLKERADTRSIPVILTTAKVRPLVQAGIDPTQVEAVLTKPFRPLSLVDEIRSALSWS